MTAALVERTIAFLGAFLVGGTATVQLKNDWEAHGLDAMLTKILLGLMIFGCALVVLAVVNVIGGHP